jgi:hypothetical protein
MAQNSRVLNAMHEREEKIAKTSLSFELGGNALIYSFNFDRVLIQSDFYKGTIRVGAGMIPFPESLKPNRVFLFVPVEYNNLFGPRNHFFEFGLGTTLTNSLQGGDFWISGRVGYRMQPWRGGFFFRTGLVFLYIPFANPQFYGAEVQDIVLPIPSVSWGVSF